MLQLFNNNTKNNINNQDLLIAQKRGEAFYKKNLKRCYYLDRMFMFLLNTYKKIITQNYI